LHRGLELLRAWFGRQIQDAIKDGCGDSPRSYFFSKKPQVSAQTPRVGLGYPTTNIYASVTTDKPSSSAKSVSRVTERRAQGQSSGGDPKVVFI